MIVSKSDRFFNALVAHGFQMPENLNTLTTNFKRTGTYDKIAWVNRDDFVFNDECNVVPYCSSSSFLLGVRQHNHIVMLPDYLFYHHDHDLQPRC